MPHTLHSIKYIFSVFAFSSRRVSIKMGCLSLQHQLLCLLLFLLFHSPLSFSTSLSSISPCSALLQFNNSLSLFISCLLLHFIHLEFRCVILHIQRQSLGRKIRTAVLGMASCVTKPRHVIGLDLSRSWLNSPIHSNNSLFFLRHLRSLNLAGNIFNYSLISSEFGNFKALTHLNLSNSYLSGKLLYKISQLSSLVSLDLSYNDYC